MSKFEYMSEGKLDSQYLLDLIKEYLDKIAEANDVNGVIKEDFNINCKANRFVRFVKDKFVRLKLLFKNKDRVQEYNKLLANHYIDNIKENVQILLETNVLQPIQVEQLKQTLEAINFEGVLPEIDEGRYKAIKQSHRRFLKSRNDIKYLKHINVDYVLFNSPVPELKPFLSDKVSAHKVKVAELDSLLKQFVQLRYKELNNFEIDVNEHKFNSKPQDFYNQKITDNGVGEEVEDFIRSKIIEKSDIMNQETILEEDKLAQIATIDNLLKRLKLSKIEKMIQRWIDLQTNLAQSKEVADECKEIINSSTISNKKSIFLIIDNLFYKLSTKCDKLTEQIKLKLQLVDKQKVFNMLEQINSFETILPQDTQTGLDDGTETLSKPLRNTGINTAKNHFGTKSIASNLYDDEDEHHEIHVSEDDDSDDAEEEIVIE